MIRQHTNYVLLPVVLRSTIEATQYNINYQGASRAKRLGGGLSGFGHYVIAFGLVAYEAQNGRTMQPGTRKQLLEAKLNPDARGRIFCTRVARRRVLLYFVEAGKLAIHSHTYHLR